MIGSGGGVVGVVVGVAMVGVVEDGMGIIMSSTLKKEYTPPLTLINALAAPSGVETSTGKISYFVFGGATR